MWMKVSFSWIYVSERFIDQLGPCSLHFTTTFQSITQSTLSTQVSYKMNQGNLTDHGNNRDIHPQRIHLSIKRSKRCRTCRHILIRPEQKAQITRFKIKLVAM